MLDLEGISTVTRDLCKDPPPPRKGDRSRERRDAESRDVEKRDVSFLGFFFLCWKRRILIRYNERSAENICV